MTFPWLEAPYDRGQTILETTMYEFEIQNMTCGHCASTVEKAIKTADPEASASIDLGARIAKVQTKNDPAAIKAAIEKAGYPSSFRQL
ncbi:heavy-metal-associated domain-containing protein [Rhizobium phaseoli]|nr:heavy-metal-associated domain-containing protein [Rhizobium phaseoli]MDK4725444.1 heavy-metal-associated domain-containing protein [Rhizobium phaseoli]